MSRIHPVGRIRKPIIVFMAGALALSMSGAVGAAEPAGTGGVIKACVAKSTKAVRLSIFASPTFCRSDEVYRWWNSAGTPGATGPAGAAGAPGAPGAQGPKGDQGDPGINGTNGTNGVDGTNGIDGTNGTDGADGANGTDGADGTDGKSAYEVAVDNGFVGDEAAWLASLKGADGVDGTDGADGQDGADGTDGQDGQDGADGGLSSVHRDTGSTEGFPGNANLGETVTATATCASGSLVSGGGNVTGNNDKHYAAVTASYPSSASTWTVVATIVAGTHANGNPPSLTAYALCGE